MNDLKILLAEDEILLGEVLTDSLTSRGAHVTWAKNGQEALTEFSKKQYDVVLLDIMMPVMDGLTAAKTIRESDMDIPIIFLTAKSMKEDISAGFNAGADDYIRKPFSMDELSLRISAILRRTKAAMENEKPLEAITQIGIFTFDRLHQILKTESSEIKLTAKESELLSLLIQKQNDLLEREYALKKIWGEDTFFNARSMDVFMSKIRKYLKEDSNIEIINIRGKGYKLAI